MKAWNLGDATGEGQSSGDAELLLEMVEVLRLVSATRAPDRALAVRYTEIRSAFLNSPLRIGAPGFLLQCVSVFKFHDFINLFAPDVASRVVFVEQSFGSPRAAQPPKPDVDIFNDERFGRGGEGR
jgi:hypothetical protein